MRDTREYERVFLEMRYARYLFRYNNIRKLISRGFTRCCIKDYISHLWVCGSTSIEGNRSGPRVALNRDIELCYVSLDLLIE